MALKNIFTVFVLALLLVNSFVVSALAQPCAYTKKGFKNIEMLAYEPCHEENETSSHCDGMCFCAHVSFSATMNMTTTYMFSAFQAWSEKHVTQHEFADALALKPAHKPPLMIL